MKKLSKKTVRKIDVAIGKIDQAIYLLDEIAPSQKIDVKKDLEKVITNLVGKISKDAIEKAKGS